ncbi:prostate and testis expressed protein 1 [Mirounga angustirostris]|uniref:prostate and testis expressed protein 1 n=1 Tax=Mirounga leonina TaxID=9715 RepID=UPI00156C59D7|nr:prostate and testis expressed protein 1 [Mirounga leonina]XP_045748803.1 prostate and testis expressed protein 1 [Mirounga angustirostris]
MDKPLLLGLPLLLSCLRSESLALTVGEVSPLISIPGFPAPMTEIIQCRMCHLQFPGERCSRGRGICTATEDEGCTTGRIFKKDGTLWLTFMGCLKNCANVDKIKWSVYLVKFRCCRGYDLCNETL